MSLTVKRCLCCALALLLLVFIVTIPMASRAQAVSEVLLAVPVISAILGLFAAWGIEISSQGLSGSDLYGWVQDQFNEWWALQQGKQMALELAGLSIWRGMLKVGRDFVNQVREFAEWIVSDKSLVDNSSTVVVDNAGLISDKGFSMALISDSSVTIDWYAELNNSYVKRGTRIVFNPDLDGYFFVSVLRGNDSDTSSPQFQVAYIGSYDGGYLYQSCSDIYTSSSYTTRNVDHTYTCRFGDSSSYVEQTVLESHFGGGWYAQSVAAIQYSQPFSTLEVGRMFGNYNGNVTYWFASFDFISLVTGEIDVPGQDIEEGSDAYIDVVGIPLESVEQAGTVIQDQVMEGELEVDLTVADSADSPAGSVTQFQTPGLSDVFPFCIPFDIYAFFSVLAADPVAPSFSWDMEVPGLVDYTIEIDLSIFDTVAQVVRTMELLAYCVALAVATRDLIKG